MPGPRVQRDSALQSASLWLSAVGCRVVRGVQERGRPVLVDNDDEDGRRVPLELRGVRSGYGGDSAASLMPAAPLLSSDRFAGDVDRDGGCARERLGRLPGCCDHLGLVVHSASLPFHGLRCLEHHRHGGEPPRVGP